MSIHLENKTPPAAVAEALKLLDQVKELLGLTAQPMTVKEKKAATRSRNLALARELEAVQAKLTSLSTIVGSNADLARSGSWNTAMTLYGMLKTVAHRDPQLASQLAPAMQFFAYRTPAAKKAHPKQKGKKAARAAEKDAASPSIGTVTPRTPCATRIAGLDPPPPC